MVSVLQVTLGFISNKEREREGEKNLLLYKTLARIGRRQ